MGCPQCPRDPLHLTFAGVKAATAVRDLDNTDEEDFALMAATAAAGHRIVLAAADDFGLVDFDEAGERAAAFPG